MRLLLSFVTTKLWISLIPAALVALACIGIIIKRWAKRDPIWFAAVVTLPVMFGKLLLAWTIEPLVVFMLPIGFALRGLTILAFVPEVFVFLRMLDANARTGEPWLQAINLTVPFGSILIGAVAALVYKKIRDEK